jgi:dihydrofolate reductase
LEKCLEKDPSCMRAILRARHFQSLSHQAHREGDLNLRNLISLMHVSLDGFVAGPNGEIDWAAARGDDELWETLTPILSTVDAAIFGRVTYGLFVNYWPTAATNPSSSRNDVAFAHWIENVAKIVISKSMKKVEWKNTELIAQNIDGEIAKKKNRTGKSLLVFGSPSLTAALIDLNLMDEMRMYIHPIFLGKGKPFLESLKARHEVKLMDCKSLRSGVVALRYGNSGPASETQSGAAEAKPQ